MKVRRGLSCFFGKGNVMFRRNAGHFEKRRATSIPDGFLRFLLRRFLPAIPRVGLSSFLSFFLFCFGREKDCLQTLLVANDCSSTCAISTEHKRSAVLRFRNWLCGVLGSEARRMDSYRSFLAWRPNLKFQADSNETGSHVTRE